MLPGELEVLTGVAIAAVIGVVIVALVLLLAWYFRRK